MLTKMLMSGANAITLTYIGNYSQWTPGELIIPTSPTSAVGDIAILFDTAYSTTVLDGQNIPGGWTSINLEYMANGYLFNYITTAISYKILTSGDLGSTVYGYLGDAETHKTMIIVRPSKSITTVNSYSPAVDITDSDPPDHSHVLSNFYQAGYSYIVYGKCLNEDSSIEFSSTWYDHGNGVTCCKIFNNSYGTVTIGINDLSSTPMNILQSGVIGVI